MEKEQKEFLLARRVKLVDDIDITGGLFTQLRSRHILNKRSVNNIKNKGPPEAQVEALLDLLAQRDCFDQFCEALKADYQEHIVKKYLKAPTSVPVTTESTTTPSADPSPSTSSSSTKPKLPLPLKDISSRFNAPDPGSLKSKNGTSVICKNDDKQDSWSVSVPAAAPAQSIDLTSLTPTLLSSLPRFSQSISLDQIDLSNVCVNVNVEPTTHQFFMSSYEKAYPMHKFPRGLALIINVSAIKGTKPRNGTNIDRDNLGELLSKLHFNVVVYNDRDDLSAQGIFNKLQDFAKMKEHKEMDACFVCLLSHGEEGYIFGTDGERILLDNIFRLFDNTNCKGLIGKPKVFILQACRGNTHDKGVCMDEPDAGPQLPSRSDMLICNPTLAGYVAWRNRAKGSLYIGAIVQVFMRCAKNEDICTMLNRVNQLVSRTVSGHNQMSQMPEYINTLTQPHLYLFPGIECIR